MGLASGETDLGFRALHDLSAFLGATTRTKGTQNENWASFPTIRAQRQLEHLSGASGRNTKVISNQHTLSVGTGLSAQNPRRTVWRRAHEDGAPHSLGFVVYVHVQLHGCILIELSLGITDHRRKNWSWRKGTFSILIVIFLTSSNPTAITHATNCGGEMRSKPSWRDGETWPRLSSLLSLHTVHLT
jgi:hypothetical protein